MTAGRFALLSVVTGCAVGLAAYLGLRTEPYASSYFGTLLVLFLVVAPLIGLTGFVAGLRAIRRNIEPQLASASLVISGVAVLLWLSTIVEVASRLRVG